MISADNLRKVAKSLLGDFIAADFPYDKVAAALSEFEESSNIKLSPYGYVMWAVDHHGYKCAYKNLMASQPVVSGYAETARKYRDDMPAMLVNAHTYVSKVLSNVADLEVCLRQLEGMTFPYVLYILFAGGGQADVVQKYRTEVVEQLKRYPSTLDLLPESYKKAGQEACDADTE